MVTQCRSVVAWGQGWRQDRLDRVRRELPGVMELFCILIVLVGTQVWTPVKPYQTVHLECTCTSLFVNYMSREFVLNNLKKKSLEVFLQGGGGSF